MRKITNDELGRLTPEQYTRAGKIPVVAVADNIRSLNNVGSLFRTCDAFTAERLVLCGISACPPHRDIHKTALGAENTVEWEYYPSAAEAVKDLAEAGYTVLAVEQAEGASMLQDFECGPDKKYALVFGNEVAGVSQQVMDLCDGAIEIPQAGTKHSLNVAVSAGVVLWHFFSALTMNK